jgi:hypothetical protein
VFAKVLAKDETSPSIAESAIADGSTSDQRRRTNCSCQEQKQSARYLSDKGALSRHHRTALSIYRWCERNLRSRSTQQRSISMAARISPGHSSTFEYRLAQEANNLRLQAKGMPLSVRRTELLRKARQIDIAGEINNWLTSPGLQPPS